MTWNPDFYGFKGLEFLGLLGLSISGFRVLGFNGRRNKG
jgi:hypothetical protein